MFKSADTIGIITIAKRSSSPLCPFEGSDIIQNDYKTEYKNKNIKEINKNKILGKIISKTSTESTVNIF